MSTPLQRQMDRMADLQEAREWAEQAEAENVKLREMNEHLEQKVERLRAAITKWRRASFFGNDHEYQVAAEELAALAQSEAVPPCAHDFIGFASGPNEVWCLKCGAAPEEKR